ncbi:MAG: glycoside hydrolase family 2 TIM barrel-domain containing protein [Opitutaceae bacterium]
MAEKSHVSSIVRAAAFAAAFLLGAVSAPAAATGPLPRGAASLDSGWRFRLGDEPGAAQPGFDDSAWRVLDLPHDWSIEGPFTAPPEGDSNGGFFMHGIGWYRKSFTLPATSGGKFVAEFDGVYMNSDVWINGHFLGRRPYGFIGFRYDLTEYLKTDGTANVLAVRVDDSLEPSLRWYAGSGIYRHVRLITTPYTHFRLDGGVSITTPEITAAAAVVEARYIVDANFFSEEEHQAWLKDPWKVAASKRSLVLRSAVLAPDGSLAASAESTLELEDLHAGWRASQRITVASPRLWSDATPALYRLRSTLLMDGAVLDETTTTFGIRRLEFDPDRGLLVNGRPTKLKGVCLHQDAGSFGNAVPSAVWAWRLSRLKEAGCNAVRTSHHPFAPEFYDLCDEMGLYVFDEAFDEWTRGWPYNFTENPRGKAEFGYHYYFSQWHETDLRAMLRRDRNHPCVVLYSIGNEIPNQLDPDGAAIARQLVAICHEEDPTRPATSACDQSHAATRNGFMDALDLAGYNYVDRLYGDQMYAPERARFPHRLCLGTETAHSVRNWLGVRDADYVIGEFIWTGIDYLGESKLPRRGSESGLLDLAGGAKPQFYQFAAYWRDDPVLELSVLTGAKPEFEWRPEVSVEKWNWPAGSTATVRAATNCDEVELILNGRSQGRHAVSRNLYSSDWSVPFAPGELAAVGYRAGKAVAHFALRTAGDPSRLVITPLTAPFSSDAALYEITVVDAGGVRVMDATPTVTVGVGGAGRLIGLDSGDLGFGGVFKANARAAYQGRLLATVWGGAGRLSAEAPGLSPAALDLDAAKRGAQ